MDQVSRPLLIALLATVFVAAGWMAFMRPAAVESTTEEVTAPAQVATQAAEAAKATDATSAATEAAADAATADPSATQAPSAPAAKTEAPVAKAKKAATPADTEKKAEPKAAKADPQAKVLAEMDSGKVVVLLFWDKSGADDRARATPHRASTAATARSSSASSTSATSAATTASRRASPSPSHRPRWSSPRTARPARSRV